MPVSVLRRQFTVGECAEVYTEPAPEGYRGFRRFERGDSISLPGIPEISLPVEPLL